MKIALDAMGGDFAPERPVEGAILALQANPQITKLFLVGDQAKVEAELKKHGFSDPRMEIVHASEVVEMSEKAAAAVRRKKDSSISRATDLVKEGTADAVVSAGHTGAAVTAAILKLRTLPGIDRPGIAAPFPTEHNVFILIDAGANIDPTPTHLLHYAIMGGVYSRHVLGYKNPSIGLMSIGAEEGKGDDFTQQVFKLLKQSNLNFRGHVEGHDLFEHPVEVVVTDGFVGNVVLKSCESIAMAIFGWLRNEIKATPVRKVGGLLAKGAFKAIWKKTNPEEYGGSPLLGVNGICIIAHGGSTAVAIKNAIRVAAESIQHQVNPHIVQEISKFNEQFAQPS
jgi:glycerol-3-phosphate acyltransferase PlsX